MFKVMYKLTFTLNEGVGPFEQETELPFAPAMDMQFVLTYGKYGQHFKPDSITWFHKDGEFVVRFLVENKFSEQDTEAIRNDPAWEEAGRFPE